MQSVFIYFFPGIFIHILIEKELNITKRKEKEKFNTHEGDNKTTTKIK